MISPDDLPSPGLHIRRRDDGGIHGWRVRVQRNDVYLERLFSDNAWGGMAQALVAARQWRDQQPWYRPPREKATTAATKQTLLSVMEIARHESMLLVDGCRRRCAFWSVSWIDAQGKTWTRKFSVNFWGEEVARQRALAIHAQQLRWAQTPAAQREAKARRQASNSAKFVAASAQLRA